MRAEYTNKLLALCMGVVVLLSVTFALAGERVGATKLAGVFEAVELVSTEPVAVQEPLRFEEPATSTRSALANADWSPNVTAVVGQDDFRFRSDGYPNHELPNSFLAQQQRGFAPPATSSVSSIDRIVPLLQSPIDETITVTPVLADEPTPSIDGLIGVLINGVQVDGDSTLSDPAVASIPNLDYGFVDLCNGHPLSLIHI